MWSGGLWGAVVCGERWSVVSGGLMIRASAVDREDGGSIPPPPLRAISFTLQFRSPHFACVYPE